MPTDPPTGVQANNENWIFPDATTLGVGSTTPSFDSGGIFNVGGNSGGGITFQAGAPAYTFTQTDPANTFNLAGSTNTSGSSDRGIITNNSTVKQIFDMDVISTRGTIDAKSGDIEFKAGHTFTTGGPSTLSLSSTNANSMSTIFQGDHNIYLNSNVVQTVTGSAGTSGRRGQLLYRGATTPSSPGSAGALILGDLGTYGGRITVDSTNGGVVRATHNNSFGIYGGTTQSGTFIGNGSGTVGDTSNATVELDGSAGNFTTQESFYVGMRDPTNNTVAQMRNVAGNNTITGFFSLNSPTSGANLNVFNSAYIESLAGKLIFQGSISNDRTLANNPSTTNLYFKGNGDFDVGGGIDGGIYGINTNTFILNVDKTGNGTVTLVAGLNPVNNWSGTTTIHAGKWIVNGTHTTAGAAAYTVENGGTVGGSGYVASGVTINPGGTLAPGASLGTFTVGSAIFNTDSTNIGKLQIEYNNASTPKIDKLVAVGNLDITNAIVDFQDLGGPLTGAAHVFASYGALTGSAFSSVLNLPAGYVINYNYVGGVQGDYNNNGVVDAADYVVWLKNNGSSTNLPNEVIGVTPGQVTIDDYDAWRSRFGNITPSGNQIALVPAGSGSGVGGASAAVPEPSTLALIGLLASLLIIKRRSRTELVFVPHIVVYSTL